MRVAVSWATQRTFNKMGELPHFIEGVPEESISKQKVTRKPTRIQEHHNVVVVAGFADFFTVPQGYFAELVYFSISAVAKVIGGGFDEFSLQYFEEAGGQKTIHSLFLDHLEHANFAVAFPKPLILESGWKLRANTSSGGTSIVAVRVFVNLIPNQDRDLI